MYRNCRSVSRLLPYAVLCAVLCCAVLWGVLWLCAVAGDDEGELRLADLMAAAAAGPASAAASSIRSARKLLERMEKQSAPLSVPLPRTVAERVERQAGYEDTKQDVTKWQPIVKVGALCLPLLVDMIALSGLLITVASLGSRAEGGERQAVGLAVGLGQVAGRRKVPEHCVLVFGAEHQCRWGADTKQGCCESL